MSETAVRPTYEQRQALTAEAFEDPQPGDRFHEMYTWWTYVVWREGDLVASMSAAAPCTFPDDGTLFVGTVDDLKERYAYGPHMPGKYTVLLAERGNNVRGWLPPALLADDAAVNHVRAGLEEGQG